MDTAREPVCNADREHHQWILKQYAGHYADRYTRSFKKGMLVSNERKSEDAEAMKLPRHRASAKSISCLLYTSPSPRD